MKHFLAVTFLGVMAAGGAYAEGPVDVTNVNKELITSAEGKTYTIATVMGSTDDWNPTALTEQASAPVNVKLTGSTKDRETPIREFQTGNVPVFLISLKAGGAGLNFTAADTVIHYDPWWNPAAEAQASDRAHRIGQTKPVFVHKLICEGTIEERVVAMQQKKAALVEGLLTGRTDKLQLTQSDIQALFAVE